MIDAGLDHPSAAQPAPEPVAVYAGLLARLRSAESGDADAAWLGRELEQAVRARETIVVAVRLPDGTEREFTIEATGLGGGRLRGLDRNVDVLVKDVDELTEKEASKDAERLGATGASLGVPLGKLDYLGGL